MNAGVALRGNRGVAAGCLVGQTHVEKAESRARQGCGEKHKAADFGSLMFALFLLTVFTNRCHALFFAWSDSKPGQRRRLRVRLT